MERSGIYDMLEIGKTYDLITKYKEVPVKTHLKLSWIDDEGDLVGFDWKKSTLKGAFSTLDPVYIKLNQHQFLKTQVFSNLGKELVLSLEDIVPPPDFIKRRSVRVQPDENNPVKVQVKFGEKSLIAKASDVSETGVGMSINPDSDEHRPFIDFLKDKLNELKEDEFIDFDVEIYLPEGEIVMGKGRLKNVIGLGRDIYVRLGFEVSFPKQEITKIRKYVMNRQKEIIQSLRFFG